MAKGLWLVCACVAVVLAWAADPAEVHHLHESTGGPKLSLLEEQESTGAMATAGLSASEAEEFRAKFKSVAAAIKSPSIRSNVLLAERCEALSAHLVTGGRMASDALDQGRATGSGLDLIFSKLVELEEEIKTEQSGALKEMNERQTTDRAAMEKSTNAISTQRDVRTKNKQDIDNSYTTIQEKRDAWTQSRETETSLEQQLQRLRADRETTSNQVRLEVDERNKALDVLVKALFLVCERFNRFKDTTLCLAIKSQPDVQEPTRYETQDIDETKEVTEETHGDKESDFRKAWSLQEIADEKLADGNEKCPDNPDHCPANAELRGDMEITMDAKIDDTAKANQIGESTERSVNDCAGQCNNNDSCKGFQYEKTQGLCQLTDKTPTLTTGDECCISGVKPPDTSDASDDEVELLELGESVALSSDEHRAVSELKKLTKQRLADKYAIPLQELLLAVQQQKKKRKNMVQIIIQVIDETRVEQQNAKSGHTEQLDSWYSESWTLWDAMNTQKNAQAEYWAIWQDNKKNIAQLLLDTQAARKTEEAELTARLTTEQGLNEYLRTYGIDESLREEDLENLVKLRSLLRSLYDETKPQGCPRTAGVLCTDKIAGWCVFDGASTSSKDQRCSCNVGFYGNACQFRMCPGNGDVLYRHDQEGVCSNRGSGQVEGKGCDNQLGKCHCHKDYYHGEALKCEYRHAPPSKYATEGGNYLDGEGVVDDKCSGHMVHLDKIRGICHCEEGWWGEAPNAEQHNGACETKKCPDSSRVLWPYNSGNACSGHGACNPYTGRCSCQDPYFSEPTGACEKTKCPRDCTNKGACTVVGMNAGICACNKIDDKRSWEGPACEFQTCPADCGGSQSGQCDRNSGLCVCKMGYTGESCQKSQRCTARSLKTDEANWYTLWDKPGWIACPHGQLLYELEYPADNLNGCTALSCIDTGKCAAACQGDNHVYQLRHCYHELGWYNSMDQAGWSRCLQDYYVAGLYRSCESLYCLQMAKCCSLKEARWSDPAMIGKTEFPEELGEGDTEGEKAPRCTEKLWGPRMWPSEPDAFITGFKRGTKHDVNGFEAATYCSFVRGY